MLVHQRVITIPYVGFSMVFSSISWMMHWNSCACQAAPLLDCFSGPQEASLFPEHLCCDAEQWPPSGWWKCGWAVWEPWRGVKHNRTKYHGWLVSHVASEMGVALSMAIPGTQIGGTYHI